MDNDSEPRNQAPMPSSRKRRVNTRGRQGSGRRKRKRTPKYRDMVIKAIKGLKDRRGVTHQMIAKQIEQRYRKRNDFVIKHVIRWLCQKRVLTKKGGRYKLTGKKLKLQSRGNLVNARRKGARRRRGSRRRGGRRRRRC